MSSPTPWQAFLESTSHHLPSTILLHGNNLSYLSDHARQLAAHILGDAQIYEEGKWAPDLYEHAPTGKARVHLIDTPRTIQKTLWLEPYKEQHKVYIVHEVDRITIPAVSAFLKILEEPPTHSLFILTTIKKQQLPPTILSRCFALYLSQLQEELCNEKQETYLKLLIDFITEQTSITQIEDLLLKKSKESANKSEAQELTRYVIDLLGKMLRDRYIFAHTQNTTALYFPNHIKEIQTLPLYPMEKVVFVLDQAALALDNSTASNACLQWIFLQLKSLQTHSETTK